jgi:hypothetical protein
MAEEVDLKAIGSPSLCDGEAQKRKKGLTDAGLRRMCLFPLTTLNWTGASTSAEK